MQPSTDHAKRGRNNKQRSKGYERTLAADLGVTRLDAIPGYAGSRNTDIRYESKRLSRIFDIEVKSRIRANVSELFKEAVEKCKFGKFPVLALVLRKGNGQHLEKYAVISWADFVELIHGETPKEEEPDND